MYNLEFSSKGKKYIYNSLSGELVGINDGIIAFLDEITNNSNPANYIYYQQLRDKGFIVNAELDEFSRYIALKNEQLYSRNSASVSYVIALTTNCNYKCVYCYENGCNVGNMTDLTANQLVDFIISECDSNLLLKRINITWFGGEPLLAIDKITLIGDKVLSYSDSRGIIFQTNIITNGYYLNEANLELLKKYNLVQVQITLDGEKELYNAYKQPNATDAFETVLDNIRTISKSTNVDLRLNCSHRNYYSLKELCKKIIADEECSIDRIKFSLSKLNMEGFDEEISIPDFSKYKLDFISFLSEMGLKSNVKSYLPKPRTIPCGLMKRSNFVIDHNGYLYKCEHFVGQKKYSVGNVVDGLLYPVFQHDFEDKGFDKRCTNCSIFPICRGGCSQKRFIGSSSIECKSKMEETKQIILKIIGG